MKKISILASLLILVSVFSKGQTGTTIKKDSVSFYEMSLEDLMKVEVTVASTKALTTRESPGIVTLVTEEEIKNSGAHDLIDILKMVPGFDFGVDVQGVVGLAVRGNWAHEGKVLMLLDGQELNENLYSTLQFGNHYALDQIKKIEIIRGPGSAIYGGNAEYAVINLISKNADDINGISINVLDGEIKNTFAKRNISVMAGKKFSDNFSLSLSALAGQGNRSDKTYTDIYGNSYPMKNQQTLNPSQLNFNLHYKNFDVRAISDFYKTTTRDGFQEALSRTYQTDFNSYFITVKNDFHLHEKFSITPSFSCKIQSPYKVPDDILMDEDPGFNYLTKRYTQDLTCNWEPLKKLSVNAGETFYSDMATNEKEGETFLNGKKTVQYHDVSFFGQSIYSWSVVNITAGARYNFHNVFGSSFVPRIGLTKAFEKFHFKLLYSKAFRSPSIANINFNQSIKPENTTVAEMEAGFKLSEQMYVTANLYDITTINPIIYFYDEVNGSDGYRNLSQTGTRGIEVSGVMKASWGYANASVEYYNASGKEIIPDYRVQGNENVLLGLPSTQITAGMSIRLGKHFNFKPSLHYATEKYGYNSVNSEGEPQLEKFSPKFTSDVFIRCKNIFSTNLEIGLGCYNLTDEDILYMQPYNSGHAPLPGPSREFTLKLSYDLHFKN